MEKGSKSIGTRNEGISTQHNPEFTMMEFYEAYADYQALMTMTEELVSGVARQAIGTDQIAFGDHQISLAPPFSRVSLREAAREAASRRLGREIAAADLRDRERAADLARLLGVEIQPGAGPGRITTSMFEALCEEQLIQPTFVYDFRRRSRRSRSRNRTIPKRSSGSSCISAGSRWRMPSVS